MSCVYNLKHDLYPSQEQLKELYDYKDGHLLHKKNGKIAGGVSKTNGYVRIRKNNKEFKVHRLVWIFHFGKDSCLGMEVDHINKDRTDNRIQNLRLATRTQNMMNRKLNRANTSGYKGVSWHQKRKKWRSQITMNRKTIVLGFFTRKKDASKAYKEAAKKYHEVFASVG